MRRSSGNELALGLGGPGVRRLVLRMAFPAVVGLSANALHQTIDAFFVSQLGTDALTAVTVCIPIIAAVAALAEGIGVGVAANVGRLLGQARTLRAGRVASTGLVLLLPIAFAAGAGLLLWGAELLQAFGASASSLPSAQGYLSVLACALLLGMAQIVCDFIAISEGNARFSMWTLVGSFLMNGTLTPIFLFIFDSGVAGAAVATVLSQMAVVLAYLIYFLRRRGSVPVSLALVSFSGKVLKPILSIGWATTATSILTACSFVLVYRLAAGYGGDAAVAALGVTVRLAALGTLPIIGFALGTQAVLGFAFGRGEIDRLREASAFLMLVTTTFACGYAILLWVCRDGIAQGFNFQPAARDLLTIALGWLVVAFPLVGVRFSALVLLQALAQARAAAALTLAANGYLLLPALVVLPLLFGFSGIPASLALGNAGAGALAFLLLLKTRDALKRRQSD